MKKPVLLTLAAAFLMLTSSITAPAQAEELTVAVRVTGSSVGTTATIWLSKSTTAVK